MNTQNNLYESEKPRADENQNETHLGSEMLSNASEERAPLNTISENSADANRSATKAKGKQVNLKMMKIPIKPTKGFYDYILSNVTHLRNRPYKSAREFVMCRLSNLPLHILAKVICDDNNFTTSKQTTEPREHDQ